MEKTKQGAERQLMEGLAADSEEYAHFLKLDEEKRERILTAAYDEFLEKGYNDASTNSITQKAGISKGLLFRYFGCKAGLYKFLMKEATRRIASETLPSLPSETADVFALIKAVIRLKISVCLQCPRETKFMIAAWEAPLPESLSLELGKMVDMSGNYVDNLVAMLDNGLLRDGVEKGIAVDIIAWVCEKYTDKVLSGGRLTANTESWNQIAEELDRYLDALRRGLYKQ